MSVFIEGYLTTKNQFEIGLETFIVYNLAVKCDIKVNLFVTEHKPQSQITLNLDKAIILNEKDIPDVGSYCKWPILITNDRIVAGLCAVCREILKLSEKEGVRKLLGFKESCLMACSETSTWTKFCEVDLIDTTKEFLQNPSEFIKNDVLNLPDVFCRFEYHLKEPVRMHNIYKIAREIHNDKDLKSNRPIKDLNLNHLYLEGLYMSLIDCIIYFCYKLIFNKIDFNWENNSELVLSLSWFKRMELSNFNINIEENQRIKIEKIKLPSKKFNSLYNFEKNDIQKETNVTDEIINNLLSKSLNNLVILNDSNPFGEEINFNWDLIPLNASPEFSLPKKRSKRKREQLENLTKAVIKLTQVKLTQIKSNQTLKKLKIVDFCSGSGHLGILLSILLPNSQIILVENKERSLQLALNRISSLKLTNIIIIQSNLDYFIGKFNIGVSLHACGVATDLVIQKSIENKADFVCCPCCYGGIKNCHQVNYPRSDYFKDNLSYKDYSNVTRGADQTHDENNPKTKNGFRCMDIVDTDRKLYAKSFGYDVYLGKLKPATCTVKNNLLVGVLR